MNQQSSLTLRWPSSPLPAGARDSLIGPGAPFELVEEKVAGARMSVFARRPPNLGEVLRSAADRFGARPYLVFPDRQFTFDSITAPVASAAAALQNHYGIRRGDRVAIAAANSSEYMIALWAIISLGAIAVGLNGWWTGAEMSYAIGLTEPRLIFGDQRRLERLGGQDIHGAEVLSFEDHFRALESYDEQLPDVLVDEDDPAFILFTSGTTGRPKGAMLSHRNCVHFGQALLLGGAETALRLATDGAPPDPPDPGCVISSSPVFHTSGLNGQVIAGAFSGMTTVFPPPGKWREDLHLELTERHSATMWSLVPTQLWRLLERPDLDRYELSSLRRVSGGGTVWPPEILRALAKRLPWVFRHVGYGMTESTAMGTGLRGEATFEHPDSIGQPGPTVEIEVRDSARSALGEGFRGEICIRSAGNFLGYWKNPEATKQVLDDSGWYHTGDYGYHRGGLLYLDGRRSDLIIRGGENVYPAEIENRLIEHPEIMEAAVIGSPHHILGQEVHAYVVPGPGSGLNEEDIRAWAAETLSAFKVPARVELVQELPHNAAGKVLKRFLENPGGIGDMVPD